jgi:hypothetical protein
MGRPADGEFKVTTARRVLVPLVGLAVAAAIGGSLLTRFYADPTFLPPHDFLEYYSAGRLLVQGGDPYDADQLRPVQLAAGRHLDRPVIMWNPPWALAFVAPFGQPDARTGQLLWVGGQVLAVVGCSALLWRTYGGPADLTPLAVLVGLTFPPVMYVATAGQSGGWLLLGVTALAVAAASGRPWVAAFAAVAALKPHLFLPIWVVLALNATTDRKSRSMLMWGVGLGLAMTLLPLLFNPDVWADYLRALRRPADDNHPPLSGWRNPLIGFFVRDALDISRFWIQMVPTAVVAALTPLYWWPRRHLWDWPAELPRLLLAGLIAAPYGAWEHDLTVLLVVVFAVLPGLVREGWTPRTVALAVGYLLWCGAAWAVTTSEYFVWMTPTAVVGYWAATRPGRSRLESPRPESAAVGGA